jgi:hypothetical protein
MTYIKLGCCDALIYALDNFLCNPEWRSVYGPSIADEYLLYRVHMIHVQAIAELVDASGDLPHVNRNVVKHRVMDEPCQTGRVLCA